MTVVDPYVVRIPDFIRQTNDPELISWFEYDNRWKHDLWQLVTDGTGEDQTEGTEEASANENQIAFHYGLIASLLQRVKDLEAEEPFFYAPKEISTVATSNNYTASDFDFVNANNGATISLPANPSKDSVVIIRNGDGSRISLDGNGRNINGSSSGVLYKQGTAIEFYYFIDSNEWFAR